jgi:hypothetical protein
MHAFVQRALTVDYIGQINLSLIVANLCSIPVDRIGANDLSRDANGVGIPVFSKKNHR